MEPPLSPHVRCVRRASPIARRSGGGRGFQGLQRDGRCAIRDLLRDRNAEGHSARRRELGGAKWKGCRAYSEDGGIAQLAVCNLPEPPVVFGEHKGPSFGLYPLRVPVEYCIAGFAPAER